MPITTTWYDDRETILLLEYSPNWTEQEHRATFSRIDSLLGVVGHPVDLIMILPDVSYHHQQLELLMARRLIRNRSTQRQTVVVCRDPFVRDLNAQVAQIAPHYARNVQYVATFEDALQLVNG